MGLTSQFFHSREHARQYLTDSIITVAGEPVYVSSVLDRSPISIEYIYMGGMDTEPKRIAINSPLISLVPVKLGYVNYTYKREPYLTIAERIPMRAWKIGLTATNLVVKGPAGYPSAFASATLLCSAELRDTIKGWFPTYRQAIAIVERVECQIAFSRNFAVGTDHQLLYKGATVPVGRWDEKEGSPILRLHYSYLQQLLLKDLKHGRTP